MDELELTALQLIIKVGFDIQIDAFLFIINYFLVILFFFVSIAPKKLSNSHVNNDLSKSAITLIVLPVNTSTFNYMTKVITLSISNCKKPKLSIARR